MKQKQSDSDLFLMVVMAIVNIVWAYLPTHIALIGTIIAVPLIFFIPGYLLIEILTQKREQDIATCLLLSIGLSLSIDIIGGFLLNSVPLGLTAITWGMFLSLFTIVGVMLCITKRRKSQLYRDVPPQKSASLPIYYKLFLLLMICIVIFTFAYTNRSAANQNTQGFTQFWLLPDSHQSYTCAIQIGIYSNEAIMTTYRIEIRENNQYAASWSSIVLAPQHKWQKQLPISTNRAQATQLQIEANLYRGQEPDSMYRTTQLYVLTSKTACTQK